MKRPLILSISILTLHLFQGGYAQASFGGMPGRQFMTCRGEYQQNSKKFRVEFNARITPGPNVGTVNSTNGNNTVNLTSDLTEDPNDLRGYIYKGTSFLVLVPANQPPGSAGKYSAMLSSPSLNNGQSILLKCSN